MSSATAEPADFAALPPEINSARMYAGPGSGPMLGVAAAWDKLADELYSTAATYSSVVSNVAGEGWQGPSSASMATAAARYTAWMTATAELCLRAATQARAAANAYEAASAMIVPPSVIADNRAQLRSLIAAKALGQSAAAIAALEAEYGEMWAQDVTAMYQYASTSAAACRLASFAPPPMITRDSGPASPTPLSLISMVPEALRTLASPSSLSVPVSGSAPRRVLGELVSARFGRAPSTGALSVPPNWPAGPMKAGETRAVSAAPAIRLRCRTA